MHIAPGASPKSNWGRWQEWWIGLALFGATGGFVGWFLDPPARYFASAPLFRLRSDFFLPHLQRLGGLLEYASSFLAQLDCLAWLGGFVFAGLVLLVSLATRSLLRRSGAHLAGVWTCPGLGLLLLYGQTPTPATGVAGGILLALTFLLVVPRDRTHFPSMILCLFYVAGPLPCLLFIVSGGLHEWHHRRSPRAALTCGVWILAWLAGVAVAGNSWVPLPPKQWPDSVSIATLVGLYASYPMLFILGIWMSRRQRSETIQEKAATKTSSGSAELTSVPPTHGWPGIALALMVLAATTLGLGRETGRRHLNRLQAAAEGEDWRGVLNAATHLTYLPPAARLQLVRALYHLGRLNDDLFTFPQQSGVDLLASLSDGLAVCLPLSDTLFELGQINLAEHYAHEAMEVRGERPELLWRLARINLVKERPQAARVYLNLLSQTPFFRGRAARWLGSLDRDPTLTSEGEIVRLRSLRPMSDLVELRFSTDQILQQLVQSNRRNGMAIEYLMAHFLLTHQADQVIENIARLDDAGRRETPRHLAEAILVFAESQKKAAPDLSGRPFDPVTLRRFESFREHLRRGQPSQRPVREALVESFGETYWFYDMFGQSVPLQHQHRPQD